MLVLLLSLPRDIHCLNCRRRRQMCLAPGDFFFLLLTRPRGCRRDGVSRTWSKDGRQLFQLPRMRLLSCRFCFWTARLIFCWSVRLEQSPFLCATTVSAAPWRCSSDEPDYRWRELPQVSFLATNMCLPRQNMSFVATKICLARQTFCRDKSMFSFVATKDKTFVATSSCLS